MSFRVCVFVILAISAATSTHALAEQYVIHLMSNTEDGRFQIEPNMLEIDVGDTVVFQSDTAIHASKSIPGMLPEKAEHWWGATGDQLSIRFDVSGVYGFKCPSAYSLGMVGLILVGDKLDNLDEAQSVRHPPAAEAAFEELFSRVHCLDNVERLDKCPDPP